METVLKNCVEKSLSQFMHKNAVFLCERLCAEFPSEGNLQLLARCYLNSSRAYSAYYILKGKQMAQSRYLFAQACFRMNLFREAEAALLPSSECDVEAPNSAAGHYLLGLIYRFTGRRQNSIEHFRKTLSIDPLFWAAYEELCEHGAAEEATVAFGDAVSARVQHEHLQNESSVLQTNSEKLTTDLSRTSVLDNAIAGKPEQATGGNLKTYHKPTLSTGSASQPGNSNLNLSTCSTPPAMPSQPSDSAPPPPPHKNPTGPSSLGGESLQISTARAPRGKYAGQRKSSKVTERSTSDGVRRSARLASKSTAHTNAVADNPQSSISDFKKTPTDHHHTQSKNSGEHNEGKSFDTCTAGFSNERAAASSSTSSIADGRLDEHAIPSLKSKDLVNSSSTVRSGILNTLGLFRTLGEGCRLLWAYKSQDALDVFQNLSPDQFNTSWVQIQVGKAHFEMVDYLKAESAFARTRQLAPLSVDGMDIYSTLLFHMREDMSLSYLAQELVSIDRMAPQTWCAMGNCYSLQKDHENALKCFKRATQLNGGFTYAHTLCGHEYVAMEDYDNGLQCYRRALCLNERHYNAWYGVGVVYLRQEKYELARHHFDNACRINPHSSVLLCYFGITLHQLKKNRDALLVMERAIRMDEKNPLPRYRKALIFMSVQRPDKALEVLEELKGIAPNESSVFALMGEAYRRLEMYDKAVLNYGIALDMKPPASDAAKIKSAMEKILMPDEEDDIL